MFREDMICDGIENCVQYIKNFDPEKSSNPFAYFTQIIHYAFLRRIQKEKRQMDIRAKIIERSGLKKSCLLMETLTHLIIIQLKKTYKINSIHEGCDYYGYTLWCSKE